MTLRALRLCVRKVRSRRRTELPYGIEGWVPSSNFQFPASVLRLLGEIVVMVGYILTGVGLAWVLQVLHRGGLP